MIEHVIPAEAVEAAVDALVASKLGDHPGINGEEFVEAARAALEAATPRLSSAWHDAVSEAYVDGALSAEQANVMWAKNPYKRHE